MREIKKTIKSDMALQDTLYSREDGDSKKVDLSIINTPGLNAYGAVARSARMVDNVERLLKDECYHYHQKIIIKKPKIGGSFEWHQDYGYWYDNGILTPNLLTVFIAVDECTLGNFMDYIYKYNRKRMREVSGRIT